MEELRQKILCTSLELEAVKMEKSEEIKRYKENVKHLLSLLKTAYQERDEARDQLQKLINELTAQSISDISSLFSQRKHPDDFLVPVKANSGITESSSLSDSYNNLHSRCSSPVNSFLDAVSSPNFLCFNMEYNGAMTSGSISLVNAKLDPASVIINDLVKGKALPQKGRLLQAVMEAGPLLQTLLMAGPLPQWRNPFPLQPFKVPPVTVKSCDLANACLKPGASPSNYLVKTMNQSPHPDVSRSCADFLVFCFAMLERRDIKDDDD
ncbi:hypothetical protein EUGRSUZ_B00641 [Eucalyptus grandis]|uniref:Uncharacterized protein n=2 Tax=Eucalyptus grandis TaxID=71139 RepID=A0ACC3LN77_EUCGR|nr:hypothetical protein EUGRSUZ_B00641 [Eucalyptus grandis]